MVKLLSVVLLVSLGAPGVPDAAERAWIDVTVRVYDAASMAPADKARALAVAAAVLAPAELNVHFVHCAAAITEPSCDEALGPDELALRLVRNSSPRIHSAAPLALGDALLDVRRRVGTLATIYVDRVHGLARESQADAVVLLGRAIAHELVHLLSGQGTHTPHGLMRAVWSAQEIADNRAGDWVLRDSETAALRGRDGRRSWERTRMVRAR